MKKFFLLLAAVFCLLLLIISCASSESARAKLPDTGFGKIPDTAPDLIIEKPEPPVNIMGSGRAAAEKLALFLLQNNPQADKNFVNSLAGFYIQEAAFEGVNHDVAFAQMCLETGFLRFGGDVKPEQYNFCGLGAVGGGDPGLSFPEPRIGVRAQIQHLKAYASEEPLKGENVDPRFKYVRRGVSPAIEGLAGTWATDRQYAVKINGILQRLYDFSF
ncbi:MAG: glucosaminidase domain-containing protein [Treponema sp.]|nr:glucosaminidase domain-containing protein [Treponema sp.]